MRQVWITKAGGPEVLEVREADDPAPSEGEVRIRVHGVGVNFADIMARLGLYPDAPKLPTVIGYEVSGVVDALGPGASGVSEGDRVLALTHFGGYTDVAVAPAAQVHRIPDALSFEAAAAIPVNYLTAWLMLVRQGCLREGETVLIHAAAGGVGQAALQIAHHVGARTIGTASPGKHARLAEMGLAYAIDYTTQDFEAEVKKLTSGRGVDMVIDAVGGASFKKSYRCLSPLGRLFLFGNSSMAPRKGRNYMSVAASLLAMPRFHPLGLMDRNAGVFGVNLGHLWEELDALHEGVDTILGGVEEGWITPVVDKTFPLADAGEAHEYIKARKNFGKVVLVP